MFALRVVLVDVASVVIARGPLPGPPPAYQGRGEECGEGIRSAPGRTRTCNRRIRNPIPKNDNPISVPQVTPTREQTLSPSLPLKPESDPELAAVVEAWPGLPPDVRKMICGVVRATVEAEKAKR
jgi:hypothetical protein